MCRAALLFFSVLFALLVTAVQAETPRQGAVDTRSLSAVVDGHTYLLSVSNVARRPTMSEAHAQQVRGQHLEGRVEGVPRSWVRLSRIRGEWQGVIAIHGGLHSVVADGPGSQNPHQPLQTIPVTPSDHPADCDAEHLLPIPAEQTYTADTDDSHSPAPRAQLLTSSAICNDPVDGLCLLARLVTVFDRQFQQAFPDDFQDQAVALLNVMEGYYLNDVRVGFTDLHIEFPRSELFSSTRNTIDFLEAVTDNYDLLPFMDTREQSPLLHVVTGRSFNGSSVGAAWLGGTCSRNGFATGVTQLVNNNVTTTALVTAHEIGHNFGAVHDVDSNTCSSGFIMAAELNSNMSEFSSCSRDEIAEHVFRTISSDRCYDFPVDVALAADSGNPNAITGDTGEQVTLLFDMVYQRALRGADSLRVEGKLDDSGLIDSVQMDGALCQVASDGKSYSCDQSHPASALITVTLSAAGLDALMLEQRVILDGANVIDVSPEASLLTTPLTVDLTSIQPSDLVAVTQADVDEVILSWTDLNNAEVPYRVERQRGTGPWQQLASLPAGSEQYTDVSAQMDVSYRYRVVAEGFNGSADHSNVVAVRIESTPTPPTDVTVVAEDGSARLNWQNTAKFAVAIQVERRRLADSGSWTQWLVVTNSLDNQAQQYIDGTPLEGRTYEYRLRALNITIESEPSDAVAVMFASSAPEPDAPDETEPEGPKAPVQDDDQNSSNQSAIDDGSSTVAPNGESDDSSTQTSDNGTVADDSSRSGGAGLGLLPLLALFAWRRRGAPGLRGISRGSC